MFRMIIRTIVMVLLVILFFYLWRNPHILKNFMSKYQINPIGAERRVNEVYNVIDELDLSVENVQDDEFVWGVIEQEREFAEDTAVEVKTKSIRLFDEDNEVRMKVEEYFQKYGFISKVFNGVKGFVKEDVVCVVGEEDSDVTLECGEID